MGVLVTIALLGAKAQIPPTVTVTPDVAVLELGSTVVNKYSSPQSIKFKVTPYDFDMNLSVVFESAQAQDFYLAKRPFFDNGEAEASIMLAPKSVGRKEGYFVLKQGNKELKRIKVTGTGIREGQPEIVTDYAQLTFGKIFLGESKTINLKVSTRNSGSSIQVSKRGVDASEFSVKGTLLPNRSEQTLQITCTPRTKGEKSAELVFTDGAVVVVLPLSATAMEVIPSIVSDVQQITFPDTYVGRSAPEQTLSFTLEHITTPPVITIDGINKSDFWVRGSLKSGKSSGELTVGFSPQEAGAKTATLNIVSGKGSCSIELNGQAYNNLPPTITVTPKTVDFGRVEIQTFEKLSIEVKIENTSEIPQLGLEGDDKEIFAIMSPARANHFSLTIGATPNSAGVKRADLVIKLSSTAVRVPLLLECYASQPELTADRSELIFPETVVQKQSIEKGVSLQMKHLSQNVQVSIIGENAKEFSTPKKEVDRIAEQGYVGVTFCPITSGEKQATLRLASGSIVIDIPLRGKAVKDNATEEVHTASFVVAQEPGGILRCRVAQPGQLLQVFSADGSLIAKQVVPDNETVLQLPVGVYLISYQKELAKIIVL